MRVAKAWGYEEVLVNEPEYCAKILNISPGKKCSLHYHHIKKETFRVERGTVLVETHQKNIVGKIAVFVNSYSEGGQITILPKTPHRFSSKHGASMLEISTHHEDGDVVRLEPSGEI